MKRSDPETNRPNPSTTVLGSAGRDPRALLAALAAALLLTLSTFASTAAGAEGSPLGVDVAPAFATAPQYPAQENIPTSGAAGTHGGPAAVGRKATDTPAQILRFWTSKRLALAHPLRLGEDGKRLGARSATALARTTAAAATTGWWEPGWGTWTMVGRLYYYDARGNRYGWCSGTVVAAQNQSTIWTAGHCVVQGGTWYTKLAFAPGQNGPTFPYGLWPIRQVYASNTWAANNKCTLPANGNRCPWGYDYAVALASKVGGATIASRFGSIGVWFGSNIAGVDVLSLGYAASAPYYNQYAGYLFYCQSAGQQSQDVFGFVIWSKSCGLNGGASGGPWLAQSGGYWYLVSNNSSADTADAFGQPKTATFMNGPWLEANAQIFFNYVQVR